MTATRTLRLANRRSELLKLADAIEGFVRDARLSDDVLFALNLALDEAVVNTLSYAWDDPAARHEIELRFAYDGSVVTVEVEDDGKPFDPTAAAAVDTSAPEHERGIGGLGIHLVRQVMDRVAYRRLPAGRNLLTLQKKADPA